MDIEEFAPWRRSRRPPASTLAAVVMTVVLLGLQLAGRLSWLDLSRSGNEIRVSTAMLAGLAIAEHRPAPPIPTPDILPTVSTDSPPRC